MNACGASGCSVFAKRQTTEEERTTIGESNIVEMNYREDGLDPLTGLLRSRALDLIQLAVNAALDEVLGQYADAQTPDGCAAIVRNAYHPGREILTSVGPVMVQRPKVRTQSGKAVSCRSALVPPYVRKTKALQPAIPWRNLQHCPAVVVCRHEGGGFPRVKWGLHSCPFSVRIRPSFCRNCRPPKDGMGVRIRCLGLLGDA